MRNGAACVTYVPMKHVLAVLVILGATACSHPQPAADSSGYVPTYALHNGGASFIPGMRLSVAEAHAAPDAAMARDGYVQPHQIDEASWQAQQAQERTAAECQYEATAGSAGVRGVLMQAATYKQLLGMCLNARMP